MSIRYFMCNKCKRTSAGKYNGVKQIQCGNWIGVTISENGEEIPLGCGGLLSEIKLEKVTELAYKNRSVK